MKIEIDGTTYIQIKDLKRLRDSNMLLTNSLLFILHILSNNYLEYEEEDFIKLKDKDISLEGIDWIIDFDDIKTCSEDDIIKRCNRLITQRNKLADIYNSFSIADRIKNIKMFIRSKDLEYNINSYKDLLEVMRGNKVMELPKGVEFPDGFIKENKVKKLINKLKK